MGQVFAINENIAPLVKASSTTITMAPTYLGRPTKITVGAQQYLASSTITLNTAAANGINALDAGALAANTLYYIYAVQSSGVLGLVASTAAPTTGPAGFGAWKEIGRFRTDFGGANVNTVVNRLIGNNDKGPQSIGPAAYTPILGGGGTATTLSIFGTWYTTGQYMHINMGVDFNGAGSGGSTATLSIPTAYTINTSIAFANNLYKVGDITVFDGNLQDDIMAFVITNTTVRFGKTATSSALTGADIAATEEWAVKISVPINELIGLFD